MSFCGLIKEISLKMCILCVRVKINKRSFEPFCVWVSPFMLVFVSTCIDQDHNTHRVKKTAYFIRQHCEPVWPRDKTLLVRRGTSV